MDLAVQYIHAYILLEFSYLEHKVLFDMVLRKAGFSREYILGLQKANHKIRLNKSKIRALIGRWPASSYNSHTVTEVVDDIITRTVNREIAYYKYYTSKKDGTYTALYQLTVSNDYVLFHDVFLNKYYELIKERYQDSKVFAIIIQLHITIIFFNYHLHAGHSKTMHSFVTLYRNKFILFKDWTVFI